MMAPQVAQEGESPMSYMDFMASETWYTPLSSIEAKGVEDSRPLRALRSFAMVADGSGAIPCWGGVVVWVCSWLYPNSEADFSASAASAPPPVERTESSEALSPRRSS